MCNQMLLGSMGRLNVSFPLAMVFLFALFFVSIRWWNRPRTEVVAHAKSSGVRWPYVLLAMIVAPMSLFLIVMLASKTDSIQEEAVAYASRSSSDARMHVMPHEFQAVDRTQILAGPGADVRAISNEAGPQAERMLGITENDQPTTSAWDENVAPVANVYPGIPECGRPLAAKLVSYLQDELKLEEKSPKAEKEAPAKYRIALKNSRLDQADFLNFLINFRKEFTTAFPGSFVDDMTAGQYPRPKDAEKEKQLQRLYVSVYHSSDGQEGSAKWDDRKPRQAKERTGQIVCQLRRNSSMGQMEFTSDFIEKAWVADTEKFVTRWPKRTFIIGFSPRLATSEQEARVSALKDANARLAKSTNKMFQPNYDMERNVIDRFVQKLTMPYGSVWREAVLIDHGLPDTSFQHPAAASRGANRNADVAHPPGNQPRSILNSRLNPESMVAGLMMLTIVVGWISNWMTQGYYRGPVWTVAGTVFSIGFLFLIFVVLMNFA